MFVLGKFAVKLFAKVDQLILIFTHINLRKQVQQGVRLLNNKFGRFLHIIF